ncbi:sigma-70 family RNA polymerase sigma factor [Paucibacter sp. XJ19-41]|uniref:sigma-70 family RNA polymerase sigma factor n=1 Tax=Paucibacter sp. XJ19-41 TaxID=2927824 RepID=UPI00234BABCB|nr:sigma-70 family RNA polymerase sigma factor [Paucibacter sp. XJ19-41]MDC6165874.1 sigma-70 family RNA polymerase sigma factor [Paucibacter sp. XJ19-41]
MSDYAKAIEALRPQLLKYARLQLRNAAWAEDAVSETVLAALEKPQAFAGQSQLKTWLVGILKHKLIDQIRRNCREMSTTAEDGTDLDDELFHPDGHWREAPQDWGDPEQALRQLEFMKVLEACVELLPGQQGRLFMMREWLELDSDEICKALAITPTNLWVMLHRARLRLRDCLQLNWFAGPSAPAR